MPKKNIAIIGAGASGLMSAILLAQQNLSVTLFEQNTRVGKKILASGNGHCNITNQNITYEDFFGTDTTFVEATLNNLSFKKLEKFAATIGILFQSKDDGRTYPLSNEAKSVVLAFETMALNLGVNIICDTKITSVNYLNNIFTLEDESNQYKNFDTLIMASGSNAAPQLGGSDTGYKICETFGHSIIETFPSLVQLHLQNSLHAKMSGVRHDAQVTLYIDKKKELSITGDVLFTAYGISGLAILDISHQASLALLYKQNVEIEVNFFNTLPFQQFCSLITKLLSNLPQHTINTALAGIIPLKMIEPLLDEIKIDKNSLSKNINTKQIKNIASQMQRWRFSVSDTHGFKHAEVSGGGVTTYEVNPQTMESLLVKNLYITGELLDIVGKRGGYNFHFAFATAFSSSQAIINTPIT